MIEELQGATLTGIQLWVPWGAANGASFFLQRHMGWSQVGQDHLRDPEGQLIRLEEAAVAKFPTEPTRLVIKVGRARNVAEVLLDLADVGGVGRGARVTLVDQYRVRLRIPELFLFEFEFYDA